MKKILSLLTLLAITTTAGICAVSTSEMMDTTYMKNQGYSDETIRLVNDQIFSPHKDKFAKEDKSPFRKAWDKLNYYIDPAHDNGMFGRQNIEFTNRWDEI